EYRIVQRIYYPGFTLLGVAEVLAPLVVLALMLFAPTSSAELRLLAVALAGFIAIQAIFWLLIQPVNRAWVQAIEMGSAGARFFRAESKRGPAGAFEQLRARWEYSHLARALLSVLCLVVVSLAASARPDAGDTAAARLSAHGTGSSKATAKLGCAFCVV